MQSSEVAQMVAQGVPAIFMGLALAYMCQQLLTARFRFAWILTVLLEGASRLIEVPGAEPQRAFRVLTMLAGALACVFLFYRGRIRERVYTAVTLVALAWICLFVTYHALQIMNPVFDNVVEHGLAVGRTQDEILESLRVAQVWVQSLTDVVFYIILFLSCKLVCHLYPKRTQLATSEFWLIMFPSISSLLLCILWRELLYSSLDHIPEAAMSGEPIPFEHGDPTRWVVPCLFGVALATIIAVLVALSRIHSLSGEKERAAVLEAQMRALRTQIEESEKQQEALRRLRHDLANTVTVVSDLAKHDPQALDAYLKDLKADVRSTAPEFKTGVPVADVLLTTKAQSLREKIPGAVLDASGLVFGPDVHVGPYDLGIVLSNALDNAIEGAALAHEKDPDAPCFVRASSFEENGFLFVRVSNSVDPKMLRSADKTLKSTKSELGHGLGLRNIQTVAEKYGGAVDYRVTGGTFILSVMFGRGGEDTNTL